MVVELVEAFEFLVDLGQELKEANQAQDKTRRNVAIAGVVAVGLGACYFAYRKAEQEQDQDRKTVTAATRVKVNLPPSTMLTSNTAINARHSAPAKQLI